MRRYLLAFLLLGFLPGCQSTEEEPKEQKVPKGQRNVRLAEVVDKRGVALDLLGETRDPASGNVGKIEANCAVSSIVGDSFAAGMRKRGLLAGEGKTKWVLAVSINELSVDRVARAGASIELGISLTGDDGGATLFRRTFHDEDMKALSGDPQTEQKELRALLAGVLEKLVARILDEPQLRLLTDAAAPQ